ncbi:MAG: hypothetical protein V4607_02095 [Pseudomonadota bacterium]
MTVEVELTASGILQSLRTEFAYYAPRCLNILTKAGKLVPFKLNKAQLYIHEKLEDQLKRRGKIRAIVLKGRQQGASTYIGGRFYWRSSGEFGKRVQILTHESAATQNLFRMTKRYHDYCPPVVKPSTSNSSATELVFDKLDTRYSIATAGAQATGRSATAQFFHGSEVAFWPNAADHMAGIGQIVPDEPGTEIILESTANGLANLFHAMCQQAMRGKGDYELIFVPWFWDDGYKRAVDDDFMLEEDEIQYQELFGLSDEQMAWRRNKIDTDFAGDISLFNQEYPATIEMAFQAAAANSLIAPMTVSKARAEPKPHPVGPLILTCDPAEYGDDDTAIGRRRGRLAYPIKAYHGIGQIEIANILAKMIDDEKPDAVCVDVGGGYGNTICDLLSEWGYKHIYRINFGATALEPEIYSNRRAEMWGLMRDWIKDQTPHLPNDDVLASELSSVTYRYDSSRRLVLTSKEKMREDGIPSPDRADALALTFAVRIASRDQSDRPKWRDRLKAKSRGSAMAS